MNLVNKIKEVIRKHKLIAPRSTVIVGISGGPDSVALAGVLERIKNDLGIEVVWAHFNHALRPGAGTDQKFVEALAKKWNIPCHSGRWARNSLPQKGSLEELARMQRLKFFGILAKKYPLPVIALAHNQDDLAETVLMRILRGSGLSGIRGILPSRELNGVTFVRPLLNVSRAEILKYLKERKQPYRTDPTNRQTKFLRNKIRLELLPLLEKKYNANIREVLLNFSENASADYEFLETFVQKTFNRLAVTMKGEAGVKLSSAGLKETPAAIQRMVLRKAVATVKGDTRRFNLRHIQELAGLIGNKPNGATLHLPCNIRAFRDGRHLVIRRQKQIHRRKT